MQEKFTVTPYSRAAERNCLKNSRKAPQLWFGDTRDALIGLLDLVLAAHETQNNACFDLSDSLRRDILGKWASGI
jgi:hypothetical protein